mgnify:FL=1
MVNVDYNFYKDVYFGVVSEDLFNSKLREAIKLVENRTNNRISNINDDDTNESLVMDIKLCICSVVDKCIDYSATGGKVITSQSSGKVSESYVTNNKMSMESDVAKVIVMWLSGYGLTNCIWI